MNKAQKIAIFIIITIPLTLILGVAGHLRPSFNFGLGPPTTCIVICFLAFCTICAGIYRSSFISPYEALRKTTTNLMLDERDLIIHQKAEYAGFTASYFFFVITCIVLWLTTKKEGTINSNALPLIIALGYLAYEFFKSIAILILYGRPTEDIKTSEGEKS